MLVPLFISKGIVIIVVRVQYYSIIGQMNDTHMTEGWNLKFHIVSVHLHFLKLAAYPTYSEPVAALTSALTL